MLILKRTRPFIWTLLKTPLWHFHNKCLLTCAWIRPSTGQNSPGPNKLRDELQAAPLRVLGLSMSHEQNPFYNHFPFHFLSGWPKPLRRVACNTAPAQLGRHHCPWFAEGMFNWTAWRGHQGGAPGCFSPDGAATSAGVEAMKTSPHYSAVFITDCV